MTDKIKGVPDGWKAVEYRRAKEGDYVIDFCADELAPLYVLSGSTNIGIPDLIIERDIKIIDMSKCKVDIEIQSTTYEDDWRIDSCDSLEDPDFLDGKNYRVRQNHYFGWEGGECPLPEGLLLRVANHFVSCGVLNICSIKTLSHETDFSCLSLSGFEVLGAANGYAYKHQIGGEQC